MGEKENEKRKTCMKKYMKKKRLIANSEKKRMKT